MIRKRKVPKFRKSGFGKACVGDEWRKPKGRSNKQLNSFKGKGPKVKVGYKNQKELRGLSSNGMLTVLVRNAKDLEAVNPKTSRALLSQSMGRKKRLEIYAAADRKGIVIANR